MSLSLALLLISATTQEPQSLPAAHDVQEALVGERMIDSSSGTRFSDAVVRNLECIPAEHPEKTSAGQYSKTILAAANCSYQYVWVSSEWRKNKRPEYRRSKPRKLSRKERRAIKDKDWESATRLFYLELNGGCSAGMDCNDRWTLADPKSLFSLQRNPE